MKHMDHPHIVKVYEFFENDNHIFIVMELLENGELFDKIKQAQHFNESQAKKFI